MISVPDVRESHGPIYELPCAEGRCRWHTQQFHLVYEARSQGTDISGFGSSGEPKGVTPDKEVIAYCRIGERSSHTWFVLKYLLGYPNVRNYDGSWTEWGNLVRTPIEKP
jgi:rhodanese-related sulfurtransferase